MSFNFIKLENRKYELTPSTSELTVDSPLGTKEDDEEEDAGAGSSEEESAGTDAERRRSWSSSSSRMRSDGRSWRKMLSVLHQKVVLASVEENLPVNRMRSDCQPADGNKGGWLEGWIKAGG